MRRAVFSARRFRQRTYVNDRRRDKRLDTILRPALDPDHDPHNLIVIRPVPPADRLRRTVPDEHELPSARHAIILQEERIARLHLATRVGGEKHIDLSV